jgi:HSP20 family protein
MAAANTPTDADTPLDERVEHFFSEAWVWPEAKEEPVAIPVDVLETEDDLLVKASLPGLRTADVTIEVNQGMLTITGIYRDDHLDEQGAWHLRERHVGLTQRAILLPVPVNEDAARARLRDGVLLVRLPKVARSSRRRIEVSTD